MLRPQFVLSSLALAAALVVGHSAQAQTFRSPFDTCNTCAQQQQAYVAPPVRAVSVNPCLPCAQTTLVPRQQVTYRDVSATCYRQETALQTVPVTQMKQVTVDEGGYQMVWVPKPVTKTVAETVYQQRLTSRVVPYQVTNRVAEVRTTYVPQTVTYGSASAYYSQSSAYSTTSQSSGLPTLAPTIESYQPTPAQQTRLTPVPELHDQALNSYDNRTPAPHAQNSSVTRSAASVFRRYR